MVSDPVSVCAHGCGPFRGCCTRIAPEHTHTHKRIALLYNAN